MSARGIAASVLLSLIAAGSIEAQDSSPLRAGARVRVWALDLEPAVQVGSLLLIGTRTLTIIGDSAHPRTEYPLSAIDRLEVSRGRHPALTVVVPIGGALLGALVAPAVMTDDPKCSLNAADNPDCIRETPDPLIGAVVGAVLLGILGHAVARERWREVPLEWVQLGPVVTGGLGLSISFGSYDGTMSRARAGCLTRACGRVR